MPESLSATSYNSVRQRKRQAPQCSTAVSSSQPIDEDDQTQLVEQLRKETDQIKAQMKTILLITCWFAAGVSVASTTLIEWRNIGNDDTSALLSPTIYSSSNSKGYATRASLLQFFSVLRWLQTALALFLHWKVNSWSKLLIPGTIVYLLVVSALLWLHRILRATTSSSDLLVKSAAKEGTMDSVDMSSTYILAGMSFLTLFTSAIVHHENKSSDRALADLDASKYRFKTL